MGNKADLRRRWMGAIFLCAAVTMLIVGETAAGKRLNGIGLVIFYAICFGFVCLAILTAFLDLTAVRRRTREEQRALLEDTLNEIARQKERSTKPPVSGNSRGSHS